MEQWAAIEDKLGHMVKQVGPLDELLGTLQKKTGLSKNLQIGLFIVIVTLCLMLGYAAQLLSGLIGFIYPAYHSVRWLTYWVVFSFFHVLEFFSDHLVWWLPAYWLAKTLLLIWCMAPPPYSGSDLIYTRVIKPLYLSYHSEVDSAIDQAKSKAADLLDRAAEKAKDGKFMDNLKLN